MDTALMNGDFLLGFNGRPQKIQGAQELLQRAALRLRIPIGSFAYDPSLGSRLHELKSGDSGLNEKALTMAQEALRVLPQVTVEHAECLGNPLAVMVALGCGGEKAEIEVKI
ncbi:histidine kinase [Caproiciproducens faecalis]|uniref:Histidine kinase n=1 Tax=Caproiciproducens faecalis TaxID=2820301 RepID=A0ABS7DN38_9FIRM|nr:histidine kinase [Caproiciproducens faecalis]MBW7572713.1 histidine kinase [Caproiciproducens faecalis]